MFQSVSEQQGELASILQQELDSFDSVLQFSEKFARQVESLPVNSLAQMVNYRQGWIEKIQLLEEQRKKLDFSPKNDEIETIMKRISAAAEKLVAIDKEIYTALQGRKMKFVREHAQMVDQARPEKNTGNASRLLDILQE